MQLWKSIRVFSKFPSVRTSESIDIVICFILSNARKKLFLRCSLLSEFNKALPTHGPSRVSCLYKGHRFFDLVITHAGIDCHALQILLIWWPRPRWHPLMPADYTIILDSTQQHLQWRPSPSARHTASKYVDTLTHRNRCIEVSSAAIWWQDGSSKSLLRLPLLHSLDLLRHCIELYLTGDSLKNHVLFGRISGRCRHSFSDILRII